jgi:hypothetical protein
VRAQLRPLPPISSQNVTVSLGLIIYWDNSYIGPDRGGSLIRMSREYKANLTIAKELKNKAPQDRPAYLESIKNLPDTDDPDRNGLKWVADRLAGYGEMPEENFQAMLDSLINESQMPHPLSPAPTPPSPSSP